MTASCASSPDVTSQRPRVLVVDDEHGPRESIAFALRRQFEVDTASNAADALGLIAESQYAVIILDICMPDIDGLQALSRIRELDRDVGVVMLTGYGTLRTAQDALEGGANLFLSKPPRVAELMDSVCKQAAKTEVKRREARANEEARELTDKLKREIEEASPQLWQGRASVELVHDLANPLTVVTGYAELINDEIDKLQGLEGELAERLREYSSVVERAARYCHHLAENWRQVARGTGDYEELDLLALVEEVREVIFFKNSAIVVEDSGAHLVRGSRFELSRVFQNFFRNALEAGARTVRVKAARLPATIKLTIADDGCGMDAALVRNALKGGFSTKEHGLGIGLSICRHILNTHGAQFSLDSSPGDGTTIKLSFPSA